MIQKIYLDEWRQTAPWSDDRMVEQDLLISRILVELFNHPKISNSFAFRGGTAIYKLFSSQPVRYSEDIDLVQVKAEPLGESIKHIRDLIDPLLGKPKRGSSKNGFTLTYNVSSENVNEKQKLKIEINTREHFTVYGWKHTEFFVESRWFTSGAIIMGYQLEELIGTKLRAFYERDKGRDLFDLWFALQQPNFDAKKAVNAFLHYTKNENKKITRAMFEMNFLQKQASGSFSQDISPLLAPNIEWDFKKAAVEVYEKFITLLPGNKWKK
jgi:predicted nucleotidyltransferase component of viral defense system